LRHQEVWIEQEEGRIPVNLSVVPLADTPEEVGGVVATFSDLRPLRAMEEELRRLDRLAALGRFAAAVAHEIRNPLAAIGAGVDFLSKALGEESQADLKLLRMEVTRLDRIVVDLLEPVRGQPLQLQENPVAILVERACQAVEPLAQERDVRLLAKPWAEESREAMTMMVDGDRLLQVLVNLVRNAVEASPAGGEVEIGWEADDGEHPTRRLWVRDRGAGIAKEHLEHLFEPFFSTKSGGTGLGLYVSHSVVEQHGGKLQVESAPECGTKVTICLPSPLRQGEEACRHRS
jgi:signal transduction histidine kinase